MDKYDVLRLVGEGSFGRVYQAKQKENQRTVALKVISKRGRSQKELKGLRRECEIQRKLDHPNIIQMLDSFETEDEIYVITEFAYKELYIILGKEGYLPEQRVRTIVWDLVSALYYLHSHRVLHRDLKPQNILLDVNDCAKLCDFGFARNMSTGTHVLTSIKGTPLYMAPELIEEHPYDHNADLWSLGCIIYELLVGTPPFCTTSILHLVRMIRHEQVQWPNFISHDCISFLQGLLQKDPTKRMTWPEILKHPFVEGHIIVIEDDQCMPLTKPLPPSELEAKENQMQNLLQKNPNTLKAVETDTSVEDSKICQKSSTIPLNISLDSKSSQELVRNDEKPILSSDKIDTNKTTDVLSKLSIDNKNTVEKNSREKIFTKSRDGHLTKLSQNLDNFSKKINTDSQKSGDKKSRKNSENREFEECREDSNRTPTKIKTLHNWNCTEDFQPLESEEWLAFLQKSMQEIMNGELGSLCQPNLASIIISPLRNSNSTPGVIQYVANLLSLPFVVEISEETLSQVVDVYLNIKVLPYLIYGTKLLIKQRQISPAQSRSNDTTPTPTNTPIPNCQMSTESYRSMSDLSADELQALEHIYLLICRLIYHENQFIGQFCDAVILLNAFSLIHNMLSLSKRKLKIVTDIIAILTQVLRKQPENAELIEKILFPNNVSSSFSNNIDIVPLLRHTSPLLRARICHLLRLLAKFNCRTLQTIWNSKIQETLEALVYDSIENVRNTAEVTVAELRVLPFYEKIDQENKNED